MKTRTVFTFLVTLIIAYVLTPRNVDADEFDKKTIITTNAPIKIPNNTVLPAGKYMIRLFDTQGTRNIVQVFNEDGTRIYATFLGIPNYRLEPSDETVITFWETPSGEPLALRSWFYPGDTYGLEFPYRRRYAREIAEGSGKNVPTIYSDSSQPNELRTARVGATTPDGNETELDSGAYSAPATGANSRRDE